MSCKLKSFFVFLKLIFVKVCIIYIQVEQEWRDGKFEVKHGDEDIHTANERRLKVWIVFSL